MPRAHRRVGFTIVEILGVMLILAILIALIFPALNRMHTSIASRRAAADTRGLVDAVLNYRLVYGHWPEVGQTADGGDRVFGHPERDLRDGTPIADQALLLAALTTNTLHNPRRIRFLEPPGDKIDDDGRFTDPWNQPYIVVLAESRRGAVNSAISRSSAAGQAATMYIGVNEPAVAVSWGDPSAHAGHIYSWSTR